MAGTVYLVGAGPGAPDLLTLRAARLLGDADIVFHDALVHPDTVALAVRAQKVAVGKRCGRHSSAQVFINKRLVEAAERHAVVVRLKGGDPLLFGRAQEEIDALRGAGVAVEVVPGVTAALAAAADLQVSLSRRGMSRSVALITPRVGSDEPDSDWLACALHADTAAIYMAKGDVARLAAELLAAGKPGILPVVLVENASLPGSRRYACTLATLPALAEVVLDGPAVILMGAVLDGAVIPVPAGAEVPGATDYLSFISL